MTVNGTLQLPAVCGIVWFKDPMTSHNGPTNL